MGDDVSGRDVQTRENADFDSINLVQGSMSQPDNVEASSWNRIEASRVNKEIQNSKKKGCSINKRENSLNKKVNNGIVPFAELSVSNLKLTTN